MKDWTKKAKQEEELEASNQRWTQAPQIEANLEVNPQAAEAKEPSWSGTERVSKQGLANLYEAGHRFNTSGRVSPEETQAQLNPEKGESPSQNQAAETPDETQAQSTQQMDYELER